MRNPIVAIVALVTALVLPMTPAAAAAYPESIPLPNGFHQEDIALGTGDDFYVGSRLNGAIYKGDLQTGVGAVLVDGADGRSIARLSYDRRSGLLWAVGPQHDVITVYAFDGRSGALMHQIPLGAADLDDLVVTRDALYITDSHGRRQWALPLTPRGAPADLPQPLQRPATSRS
jgi:hypothetical protein